MNIRKKQFNMLDNRGFTLIELMVVIVILGILAGIIAPSMIDQTDEAKQMKAKVQIENLETALKLYKLHNGSYPTTDEGLQALVERPSSAKKWREGGYLEKGKVPKDPWKNDFVYICPGAHGDYDIVSYGGDGAPEGSGFNEDINNWDIE